LRRSLRALLHKSGLISFGFVSVPYHGETQKRTVARPLTLRSKAVLFRDAVLYCRI